MTRQLKRKGMQRRVKVDSFTKALLVLAVLAVIIASFLYVSPGGEASLRFTSPAGEFILPSNALGGEPEILEPEIVLSRFQRLSQNECFVAIPAMYPGQEGAYELSRNGNWLSFEAGVLEGEIGAFIPDCGASVCAITVAFSFSGSTDSPDVRLQRFQIC
ncbi:MAG: hypothetical protein HYW25_04270 [Candidatus Aenigmarchaeota archaeon]|nr:hypothetical protein [Candidatus Aenigmarchaeota archaeon]